MMALQLMRRWSDVTIRNTFIEIDTPNGDDEIYMSRRRKSAPALLLTPSTADESDFDEEPTEFQFDEAQPATRTSAPTLLQALSSEDEFESDEPSNESDSAIQTEGWCSALSDESPCSTLSERSPSWQSWSSAEVETDFSSWPGTPTRWPSSRWSLLEPPTPRESVHSVDQSTPATTPVTTPTYSGQEVEEEVEEVAPLTLSLPPRCQNPMVMIGPAVMFVPMLVPLSPMSPTGTPPECLSPLSPHPHSQETQFFQATRARATGTAMAMATATATASPAEDKVEKCHRKWASMAFRLLRGRKQEDLRQAMKLRFEEEYGAGRNIYGMAPYLQTMAAVPEQDWSLGTIACFKSGGTDCSGCWKHPRQCGEGARREDRVCLQGMMCKFCHYHLAGKPNQRNRRLRGGQRHAQRLNLVNDYAAN